MIQDSSPWGDHMVFPISHLFSPFLTNPATPHPHPNIVQAPAQWIISKLTLCELSPSCWNVWQTFLFGWRITGWSPTWMSLIEWSLAKEILRGTCLWPPSPCYSWSRTMPHGTELKGINLDYFPTIEWKIAYGKNRHFQVMLVFCAWCTEVIESIKAN